MGSKNFLDVTIIPRSKMSKNKQKSCESDDSTFSNYSQSSGISDNFIAKPILDDSSKPQSAFSNRETFTHFDFSSNGAQIKRTVWQKAVASFRSYKDKKASRTRNKSATSPSTSPRTNESQELDPIYHLLKSAAAQTKQDKSIDVEDSILERSKSIPGIYLDVYKGGCTDPTCPCTQPHRLPIVKKEDLGQQAKRELSIKKITKCPGTLLDVYKGVCSDPSCSCNQTDKLIVGQLGKRDRSIRKCGSQSPRQSSMHSRSSSVSSAFSNH